jgi:EAL domain-containing protein (putative c-di-GMP-specific phosphodiesterase class I)
VVPGFDIEADTTLQRRLARLVELRMLADIARPSPQLGWRPVGLPISPATLSSPGFQRFDQSLPAGRRQEIMLAFRACDVMADPGGFVRARDIAHQRGYRLALDDAPVGLLDVLREDRLGLDLVRLRWSADLPASMPQGLSKLLLRPDRVVLTGVDRPAAIAWGWEVGLRCFQGPLVERRQGNA